VALKLRGKADISAVHLIQRGGESGGQVKKRLPMSLIFKIEFSGKLILLLSVYTLKIIQACINATVSSEF